MSDYDPTDTKALEAAHRKAAERDKQAQENEGADFKWLMGSKRGRRIVWRSLERAGVFRLSFNTNAMSMAFAEGNKNDGIRTIGLIHAHCPELYTVMIKEHQGNDNRNNDDASHNDH